MAVQTRLGRFLGHGAGEAVEVLDCFTGDVAVGVGGLQVAAQQVGVEVLALQVSGESADQEVVVGEGVGQGVQDQALPLPNVLAVQGLQVLGAGEVGVDAAAVVGHQRQEFWWHLVAHRARGGLDRAGGGRGRQGVPDLLQARVLLRAVGDLAPLRSLARVGGGHGRAVPYGRSHDPAPAGGVATRAGRCE
ncbi:hypothetical protein [Streptomyces iakyrus]|uniref:hypothetical protein n=1 Tax=Streptomyces iakyrus TaxID=68219 RepID=UPI003D8F44B3